MLTIFIYVTTYHRCAVFCVPAMAKKTPKPPKPPKPLEPEPPHPPKPKRGGKQSNSATPPIEPSSSKPRALVSSPSWTGKLPVTLLHEHCQKLGWNKVEYGMVL